MEKDKEASLEEKINKTEIEEKILGETLIELGYEALIKVKDYPDIEKVHTLPDKYPSRQ